MLVTAWNGRTISKPGWYSGIPLEKYHSRGICNGLAVSSSDLRTCWRQSEAHMFAKWAENPDAERTPPTNAMRLGSAAHHVLLGEDGFWKKYIVPPATYRDKITAKDKPWHNGAEACKTWNAKAEAKGLTIVTADQLDTIKKIAASLALLEVVSAGMLRGHVEVSGFARDKETGLWLKIRPDVVPQYTGQFVDLKTSSDITTPAVMSSIRSLGYNQQGALMWEVADLLSHPFDDFYLMFVETAVPYCARLVPLTKESLGIGRDQNRLMLRRVATAINTGHWPGPGDNDIRPLGMSKDEEERIEARLKAGGIS